MSWGRGNVVVSLVAVAVSTVFQMSYSAISHAMRRESNNAQRYHMYVYIHVYNIYIYIYIYIHTHIHIYIYIHMI